MTLLRILHLSDLHAGQDKADGAWRTRRVLDAPWLANLAAIAAEAPPDLVCFTGDIAYSGQAHEYVEAGDFLDATLAALGVGKDRLFIVPGNHDIARDTNAAQWAALRTAIAAAPQGVDRWMAGRTARGYQPAWREQVLARQQAYRDWLTSYGLPHLLPGAADRHPHLGYRVTLAGWPTPLHIIGLDSAWLAGDDNDRSHLRLTDEQIGCLLTEQGKPLPGVKITLVHHPLADLADATRSRTLLAEYGVHLLMHGHVHKPQQQRWLTPNHASVAESVAGCLYQSDTYPNCMQLIELDLDLAGGCLPRRVWLRSWGEGFWHDDNSHYKDSKGGWLTLNATPAVKPPPLIERMLVGRDVELADMCAALLPLDGAAQPVALCCKIDGMPGVGKTHLAERFIARHWAPASGRPPADCHVRLFLQPGMVSDAEGLARQVADRLGVRYAPQQVFEALADHLRHNRLLLLVENVDNAALAAAVAALVGHLPACPVLLTARYLSAARAHGWCRIELGVLTPAAALELLRGEAPDCRAGDDDLAALALALGHLPLALHIAASHLDMGYSPELFLHKLRAQSAYTLCAADEFDPSLHADRARAILHSSFAISWDAWDSKCGADTVRRDALATLAHGPSEDCGTALGAALAGMRECDSVAGGPCVDYEELCLDAARLSLASFDAKTRRLAFHPLLGEWLRSQHPALGAVAEQRHTAWLLARLPESDDHDRQGRAWNELHAEFPALIEWLGRCAPAHGLRLCGVCTGYAALCGPFAPWRDFAARMLNGLTDDDPARSDWYWTLGQTARRAGDSATGLAAVEKMCAFNLAHGREREAALAMGLKADTLDERGDIDEALRIRREEQLPVFEKLGDARACAITMGKIADILQGRGDMDEALRIYREKQLPMFDKLGDVRSRAITMGKIADILQERGDTDEALRIRREEELPVYDKLGDVRERAIAMGKIADILKERGDTDEALRIRREEELPVYDKLGDVRSRAVAMGKIADILQERGDTDEALRIRKEEELPVYDKLGDVRSRAIAMGKIADILKMRGDTDEVLRIYREEELPVYDKLGDVRSRAITIGKIADILQRRGETEEALRIRREEELPVYDKLGDVRSRAVTMGKIADILQRQGDTDEALRIYREDVLPMIDKLGDVRSRAVAMGKIADILQERGETNEALRIRREEVLPVLDKLGDVRELLVGRANLAIDLIRRAKPGDVHEARALLELALAAAKRMRLPEVGVIEQWLARCGAP